MNRESIEPLILRDDFRSFKIITTAGAAYDITDPGGMALAAAELFYYFPHSDRSIHVPYSQIATIEQPATAKRK